MNTIYTRRSVRNFLDRAIEEEKIEQILKAAMQAPSAGNQQPWEFIVVRGQENLDALAELSPYASCLKKANVGIVVLANTKRFRFGTYWQQDLAAATQNILLEAANLRLGSVWLGVAPEEDRMDYVKEMYALDEHILPFAVVALGYPQNENANTFVDRFDETRVHFIS